MRYVFGEVAVDTAAAAVFCAGRLVPVQRRVFDLVAYLIHHRDRVVTKDELLSEVWDGVHVGDAALAWSVSQARKALGQRRGESAPIETLHGRGYRFSATLREEPSGAAPASGAALSAPSPAAEGGEALPLVGRQDVMERLLQALSAAGRGTGAVVLLTGGAGIGKTRCAEALGAEAGRRGVPVCWGVCTDSQGEHALWPWVQVLRALERAGTAEQTSRAASALLARIAPAPTSTRPGTAEAEAEGSFWALDALREVLFAAGREAPVVVVLDDLQWADAGSLRALQLLSGELSRSRLLVLATLRDEELEKEDSAILRRIGRNAQAIALGALGRADVTEYVRGITGKAPPGAFIETLHQRTGGNPFFVRELVRAFTERQPADPFAVAGPWEMIIPDAIRDVLRGALTRAGPVVQEILGAASAIGDVFDITRLALLTQAAPEVLVDLLEGAVSRGLLEELPGVGRYGFAHSLLRETVYGDLATGLRCRHHLVLAEGAEARSASGADELHLAALHRHRALPLGDPGRALRAALLASKLAHRVGAYDEMLHLHEWALEAFRAVDAPEPRVEADILLGLATAARSLGREEAARRYAGALIDLATRHRWPDLLVQAARRLRPSFAWRRTPDPDARAALELALDLAPEEDIATCAGALSLLAGIPPYSLDPLESRRLSDRAIALARPLGGRAWLRALRSGLFSRSGPRDVEGLLELTSEILSLDHGRSWLSADARYARVPALVCRGDLALAEQELDAFGQLARRFRFGEALWNHDRLRAQLALARGRFAEAEALWAELSERAASSGLWYGAMLLPSHSAILGRDRSGISPLESAVWEQLWSSARRSPRTLALMGAYEAEAGRLTEARAKLEHLVAPGLPAIPSDLDHLATLSSLSVIAIAVGDAVRARELYGALTPFALFTTPDIFLFNEGSVALRLGLLARFLGDGEAARRHLEVAVARNEELGFRPRQAEAELELAIQLSGQPRAKALAEHSAALAAELGMEPLASRAKALAGD